MYRTGQDANSSLGFIRAKCAHVNDKRARLCPATAATRSNSSGESGWCRCCSHFGNEAIGAGDARVAMVAGVLPRPIIQHFLSVCESGPEELEWGSY